MKGSVKELADQLLEDLGALFFQGSGSPILSVSGGVDSMVLLFLSAEMQERGVWEKKPIVFHMNHMLRPEAEGDQELVRTESERLGFEFHCEKKNVMKIARRICGNLEATGRLLRYRSLAKLAAGGERFAMTAHHADDFVESVLLRLVRGGGEDSCEGMGREVTLQNVLVRRPFLSLQKNQLYLVAKNEGIPFREDSSNEDQVFLRNRIRSRVLPELYASGLQPSTLVRRSEQDRDRSIPVTTGAKSRIPSFLALDRSLFEGATRREWKVLLDRAALRCGFQALAESVFLEIIKRASIKHESGFHFSYETRNFRIWTLPGSPIYFIPSHSPVLLSFRTRELSPGKIQIEYNNQSRTIPLLPGERVVSFTDGMQTRIVKSDGTGGTKKVKELFREKRIPPEVRKNVPILIDETGLVSVIFFSMFDGRADHRVKRGVTDET